MSYDDDGGRPYRSISMGSVASGSSWSRRNSDDSMNFSHDNGNNNNNNNNSYNNINYSYSIGRQDFASRSRSASSDSEGLGSVHIDNDNNNNNYNSGFKSSNHCLGCTHASEQLRAIKSALTKVSSMVDSFEEKLKAHRNVNSSSNNNENNIVNPHASNSGFPSSAPFLVDPNRKYSVSLGKDSDPFAANDPAALPKTRRRRNTIQRHESPLNDIMHNNKGGDPRVNNNSGNNNINDVNNDNNDGDDNSRNRNTHGDKVRAVPSIGVSEANLEMANDEEPVTTCNRRWLIHPNGAFRRNWDTLIAFCLLYNAVSLPFRVCFDVPASGAFKYIELLIDGLVMTDIFFNFRTAYFDEEGVLVTNPRKVALHYLKTWFTIDILATFPYDVIIISQIEGGAVEDRASVLRLPRLIRLARLIRLVRLLRLFRLTRIFQKYQDSLDKYHGLVTTLKLAVVTLMAAHFYACFWFLLTSLEDFDAETWGGAYGLSHTNLSNQYISSMHFAIQSITTVGYGDIVPVNDGERLFVVLAMLVGICVFGYSIGSIIALIVAHDQRRSQFLEKMRSINSWIEHRDIPDATASRIRAYFRHAHQTTNVSIEEQNILKELSNTLRTEVSMLLNENILRGVPFMQDASQTAITAIIMKLKPRSIRPGKNIISAGEVGQEMYVLVRGSAQVISADGNRIYATLEEGSFFGEIALIHAIPRTATVRAVTRCETLYLSKTDFDPLLEEFPDLKRSFSQEARKRMAAMKEKDDGGANDEYANNPHMIHQSQQQINLSRSMSFGKLYATESHFDSDDNSSRG